MSKIVDKFLVEMDKLLEDCNQTEAVAYTESISSNELRFKDSITAAKDYTINFKDT